MSLAVETIVRAGETIKKKTSCDHFPPYVKFRFFPPHSLLSGSTRQVVCQIAGCVRGRPGWREGIPPSFVLVYYDMFHRVSYGDSILAPPTPGQRDHDQQSMKTRDDPGARDGNGRYGANASARTLSRDSLMSAARFCWDVRAHTHTTGDVRGINSSRRGGTKKEKRWYDRRRGISTRGREFHAQKILLSSFSLTILDRE